MPGTRINWQRSGLGAALPSQWPEVTAGCEAGAGPDEGQCRGARGLSERHGSAASPGSQEGKHHPGLHQTDINQLIKRGDCAAIFNICVASP